MGNSVRRRGFTKNPDDEMPSAKGFTRKVRVACF